MFQRPHQDLNHGTKSMQTKTTRLTGPPPKQGLYDPAFEHDACGVGFLVNVRGEKSHSIVNDALTILLNLDHRGACGCEPNTGDGAGILIQIPDKFLRRVCGESGIRLKEDTWLAAPPEAAP